MRYHGISQPRSSTLCTVLPVVLVAILPSSQLAVARAYALPESDGRQAIPVALANALEHRLRLSTGIVHFSEFRPGLGRNYYTSRFAANGCVLEARGDEHGVLSRYADGRPGPEQKHFLSLNADDVFWEMPEQSTGAEARDVGILGRDCILYNLRGLGASVQGPWADIDRVLLKTPEVRHQAPVTYSQHDENGLHVVRAHGEDYDLVWWIDPHKDFNIVLTEQQKDGKVIKRSESTLVRFGEFWFPEEVRLHTRPGAQGEPSITTRVDHAEFNQPDHPALLKPKHIGVSVGTHVNYSGTDGDIHGRWDGEKVATPDDFYARLNAGQLTLDESFLTAERRRKERINKTPPAQRLANTLASLSFPVDSFEWEEYTRSFGERHNFDDAQKQVAARILKDCQEQARAYVRRRAAEFDSFERALTQVRSGDASKGASTTLETLYGRHKQLMHPIREIFEQQLKPRLERLPTRDQKSNAALPSK